MKNEYVFTGKGTNSRVRCSETDKIIEVLRTEDGNIIYASRTEEGYLIPESGPEGSPVRTSSLHSIPSDANSHLVKDASKGTIWAIERLMSCGYFS